MKILTITTMAAAVLLTAGLAYQHREEAEQEKPDSHHEMTEQAGHEQDSGHSNGDGDHGGMGHSNWVSPEEAAKRPNPIEPTELSLVRGEAAYRTNCVACHGVGARGDGQLAVHLNPAPPDLVMMAPMHPAGDLAWKIETGRGAMPAWKDMLSETQIWDVVNYLRSLGGPTCCGEGNHHESQESDAHEEEEHGGAKSETGSDEHDAHGHESSATSSDHDHAS